MSDCLASDIVGERFGHFFTHRAYLELALTAAGADENNHDGNRGLARVGDAAVQLVIEERGFESAESRHAVHGFSVFIRSRKRRASAARQAGIVECIKLCERSGPASTGVLSLAVSAIIGAVWKDSQSLDEVGKVLDRLVGLCPEVEEDSPASDTRVTTPRAPDASQLVSETSLRPEIDMVGESTAVRGDTVSPVGPVLTEETGFQMGPTISANGLIASALSYDAVLTDDAYESAAFEMRMENPDHSLQWIDCAMDDGGSEEFMLLNSPGPEFAATPSPTASRVEISEAEEVHQPSAEPRTQHSDPIDSASRCSSEVTIDLDNIDSGHKDIFQCIFDGICSPESVVTLQEVVLSVRMQRTVDLPSPLSVLSPSQRLSAIENIEHRSAYLTLIRRAHIMQLWIEHPGSSPQGDNWMVVDVPRITCLGKGRSVGNPLNSVEAEATKLLLSQAMPNLEAGSAAYKSAYRKMKRIRKLGQRLHTLTVRFGVGILGLMQSSDLDSKVHLPINITDQMLLASSDTDYNKFVARVEEDQGEILRKFSNAVEPVVRRLIGNTLNEAEPHPLEHVPKGAILELPKGSPALLNLLTPLNQ